jgi:hypothetical protein
MSTIINIEIFIFLEINMVNRILVIIFLATLGKNTNTRHPILKLTKEYGLP